MKPAGVVKTDYRPFAQALRPVGLMNCAIIGQARHVRAIRRVRSRFPRGRDTQNPEIAKPA